MGLDGIIGDPSLTIAFHPVRLRLATPTSGVAAAMGEAADAAIGRRRFSGPAYRPDNLRNEIAARRVVQKSDEGKPIQKSRNVGRRGEASENRSDV